MVHVGRGTGFVKRVSRRSGENRATENPGPAEPDPVSDFRTLCGPPAGQIKRTVSTTGEIHSRTATDLRRAGSPVDRRWQRDDPELRDYGGSESMDGRR